MRSHRLVLLDAFRLWVCEEPVVRSLKGTTGLNAVGLTLITALLSHGCSKSSSGHNVAYYRKHEVERIAKIEECRSRVDAANDSQCVAAREAHGLDGVGSLRRLPPMGLGGSSDTGDPEVRN
jgi:hypothetical protein